MDQKPVDHRSSATSHRDIFLSHRSKDRDFTRRLAAEIESQTHQGRRLMTWLDEAEIRPGQSVTGMINQGLENSRFIALVMTPAYFESETGWTDAEWHAALYQDPDNRRARLLPLLASDCPYVPILLRHLGMIDFRGNRYSDGLHKLLRVLRDEPLPRPVVHRGQLVTSSGLIDRATLIAERAIPLADPDVVSEPLYCNLLPVERLPEYLYSAPVTSGLRRMRADGTPALPSKDDLKERIRFSQQEARVEKPFMPAFRTVGDRVWTFHGLTAPDGPLAPIVERDGVEELFVADLLQDADERNIIISLLNMAIARHANRVGLISDGLPHNRFFFPPKNGGPHIIKWIPLETKATRTVAKPCMRDGRTLFWRNLGAYLKILFLAGRFYLQVTPTWIITDDGLRVRGGPRVGRLIIKWTGPERNLQVLYHIRFWTSILRTGRGPISVRAGDQSIVIATVPASVQQPYGILHDHRDLLRLLDTEAPLIGQQEDELADEAAAVAVELESETIEEDTLEIEAETVREDDDAD